MSKAKKKNQGGGGKGGDARGGKGLEKIPRREKCRGKTQKN